MRIAITDTEAFEALNPLDVKAYLIDSGWVERRVIPGRGSFWCHPSNSSWEIPLPHDKSVGDFADRIRDAIDALANVESRSPLSVLHDLERVGQDVIRVRLVSCRNRGWECSTRARCWTAGGRSQRRLCFRMCCLRQASAQLLPSPSAQGSIRLHGHRPVGTDRTWQLRCCD